MTVKKASADYPIQPLIAERWSPYAFADRAVAPDDLASLFEAARWAPSSSNEQPWNFIVATRENPGEFARLLSCLVEGNQVWAKAAPVLALAVVNLKSSRNQQDNRAAVYDVGQASAYLSFEATARGLSVHQMLGILPDKARELYQIPANSEAWTALAIGYYGDSSKLPDTHKGRDSSPRQRKPLSQFVFAGKWGIPATLAAKGNT